MTTLYLTGTRHPGQALQAFLPDYLHSLILQGHTLLTTNKHGTDDTIVHACAQHNLPLKVFEFFSSYARSNRAVPIRTDSVQVQRIYTPTWLRFRQMVKAAEKMIFFHSAQPKVKPGGTDTRAIFDLVCQKYDIEHEQYLVQTQGKHFLKSVEKLRSAPCIGMAHVYVYARALPGIDGSRHSVGFFRIETWRQLPDRVQPGIGRREMVIPNAPIPTACLYLLEQALQVLENTPPPAITIYYFNTCKHDLSLIPFNREHPTIHRQVQELLKPYPHIHWQLEEQAALMKHIGSPIQKQTKLWQHKRQIKNYRGLYQ